MTLHFENVDKSYGKNHELDHFTATLTPRHLCPHVAQRSEQIALEKIVLIATHVVSDVEYIAKEVIFLKKGQITERRATVA